MSDTTIEQLQRKIVILESELKHKRRSNRHHEECILENETIINALESEMNKLKHTLQRVEGV